MLHTAPEWDYYRRRQYRSGWQDMLDIIFSGIADNAGDEDRRQFLNLMGANLARRFAQPPVATVGEFEDKLNALWADFDWGFVRLHPTEDSLTLTHHAFPAAAAGARETEWITGLAAILEGAYAEWLRQQGGAAHVALRWQQDGAEGAMTFGYRNGL
ncbi:cellulose biosynthesis protein BcsD [Martelella alba]|nr:cellulose biosynthesis protein BcsD [Martelella alba]